MNARTWTVVTAALMLLTACGGSRSSVEMTRRIDVLQAMGIAPGSIRVTGFSLGSELDRDMVTEATWTAAHRTLPAAGSETPPCNDGDAHFLMNVGGRGPGDLFVAVEVIGDTGDDDISVDRDCGCDTHIKRLELNYLVLEADPPVPDHANLTLGKAELCPNSLDDLVVGDSEFGGEVGVDFSGTMRVVDGGLFLEVRYFVQELP